MFGKWHIIQCSFLAAFYLRSLLLDQRRLILLLQPRGDSLVVGFRGWVTVLEVFEKLESAKHRHNQCSTQAYSESTMVLCCKTVTVLTCITCVTVQQTL
jgi:hypothetical protein